MAAIAGAAAIASVGDPVTARASETTTPTRNGHDLMIEEAYGRGCGLSKRGAPREGQTSTDQQGASDADGFSATNLLQDRALGDGAAP